jgi:hypothetical protein
MPEIIDEAVTIGSVLAKMVALIAKVRDEVLNDYTHLAPEISTDIAVLHSDIGTLVADGENAVSGVSGKTTVSGAPTVIASAPFGDFDNVAKPTPPAAFKN